ncbi:MAG: tetratricopeptide repeat protein, partial [Candidatus Binatia bacterium]
VGVAGASRAESLGELERQAKSFYDLLERGQKERAAQVFPDLEKALATSAAELQDRMDRMRDEVMEHDGDIEALYRESRWRDPEIASLVITYHLAWVRYQGAQLTSDTKRKNALLDRAVEGFSQFLVVNEVPEIYAESQYGRGLAFLDLGNFGQARDDLEAAAKDPRTSAKARAALAELERRQTGKAAKAPVEDDPETLLGRLADALPKAAAGDAAIEKDTTALARGLAARGGEWPKRVDGAIASKLGDGTPTSVRSSYGLFLLGQLAIDRGRCTDVAPLATTGGEVKDATRGRHRPELLFLDAGCRMNAGKSREAAEAFETLLREFPDSARARDASYYRFRALDVARASDASLAPTYEAALTTFVARFPKDDAIGEVRYQLGELQRGRGDCDKAVAEYGRVTSGPFAPRARLGALECAVGSLVKAGKDAPDADRRVLVEKLRAFVREVPAKGADEQAVARAALMGGLLAADARPPDSAVVVEFLDKYESRFPGAKEWHTTAVQRRLAARVALGEFADAERDLDAYLATSPDADRRRVLGDLGRALQKQQGQGADAKRKAALGLARKVYGALVASGADTADRIALADLELRAGNADEARRRYDEALAKDPTSSEAMRGAARAAATLGDRPGAIARWKQVVETSPMGGTGWYEARIAEVKLLLEAGQKAEACEIARLSVGKSTTTGGDQLDKQLRQIGTESCR